jgi:predicted alpha/beta hydrolase
MNCTDKDTKKDSNNHINVDTEVSLHNVNISDLKITCNDQFPLTATRFSPEKEVIAAVLIAPATGIKRQFYAYFAMHLAEHGYGVLTFDNRGIGGSLNSSVKKSKASVQCWGEQDSPAALAQLKACFPNKRYHLIGHSAGGQLVGLMPNVFELSSMFNVACSSGSLRNMSFVNQLRAHFFMNIFIPFSNFAFGYTKSQWFGMGEPLPKAVAKQWQLWCNGKGYVKTAFGKTIHQHFYDEITIPSMWVNAIDDEIANTKNVEEMQSVFTSLTPKKLTLSPKDHGLVEIGHMKFFSRRSKVLWQHALDWLAKH